MKKLLLSGLALTVCLSAFAQNTREVQSRLIEKVRNRTAPVTKPSETPIIPLRAANPIVSQSRASMVEIPIGSTVYDLQSNYGSVGNRVKNWGDGTVSAVWTKGDQATAYPDRGTGYNYFNGTNWGAAPTARIETFRTGWPNIGGTPSGSEHSISHTPLNVVYRGTKGTGAWTELPGATSTTPVPAVTWPRMVVGGANGTTMHVIGNENANNFYVTYSRSQDGGLTWDLLNITPPNFAQYHFEGSVDGYDIDSRGDVVAFILGGFSESLTLWKSTDNGTTWTTTVVNEFPLAPWDYNTSISDVDGDGVADTIPTTDSGMSLVIDNNGVCHIAVGSTRVLCEATPDVSYFPGTDGLLYWNETMPAGDITNNLIAVLEDIDGSGVIEVPGFGTYQAGLTGMPSLGVDALNNIHLTYSSLIENTTNGNPDPACEESFRNVYYMYSTDGGMNWANPTRVEGSDFDEMVHPNMAKRVDACIHLIYHKDGEPGNTFQPQTGNCDAPGQVDVIYTCITNPVGLNEVKNNVTMNIYPNPVANILNVDFSMVQGNNVKIEMVDVLGKVAYSQSVTAFGGMNNVKVDVKGLASGVYSLNIVSGNEVTSAKVVVR
jgi:hypothetical protein